MNLFIIISILSFASIVLNKVIADEVVESLCENPVIHSADRLLNGTIRLYRNNHFWELIGLPYRSAEVKGPFRIWWPHFGPVLRSSSTHTSLNGSTTGHHYFYNDTRFWRWNENWIPLVLGANWEGFPAPNGFSAVYHDANYSGLGKPMIVGFQKDKVWYFDTVSEVWGRFPPNSPVGGFKGGQFEENFPPDITSAFVWPSNDRDVEYYVYLFRGDEYCFRSWKSMTGKDCNEWHKNKDLFGCEEQNTERTDKNPGIDSSENPVTNSSKIPEYPKEDPEKNPEEDPVEDPEDYYEEDPAADPVKVKSIGHKISSFYTLVPLICSVLLFNTIWAKISS